MSVWTWLLGNPLPPPPPDGAISTLRQHPRFNASSTYIELRAEEIEALPLVGVTADEIFELMCNLSYTPVDTYPDTVTLLRGEVGYDALARARYIEAA